MLLKINIGAFILGDKNIAQCFSCENKIYYNEGQNPLDEAFHNNCKYLHKKTGKLYYFKTQIKKKLLLKNKHSSVEVCFFSTDISEGGVCLIVLFCFVLSGIRTHIIESITKH
jgi:hypothetical protein